MVTVTVGGGKLRPETLSFPQGLQHTGHHLLACLISTAHGASTGFLSDRHTKEGIKVASPRGEAVTGPCVSCVDACGLFHPLLQLQGEGRFEQMDGTRHAAGAP